MPNTEDLKKRIKEWLNYIQEGRYDKALDNFSEVCTIISPIFYCSRGDGYLSSNQFLRAIYNYTKAIEMNPNFTEAYHRRGYAYYIRHIKKHNDNDFEKAISDYTKAIELNPNVAESYYKRGEIYDQSVSQNYKRDKFFLDEFSDSTYSDKDMLNKAISDYTKAIELNPKFAEAYKKRGEAYSEVQVGEYEKSVKDLSNAEGLGAKINPGMLHAVVWLVKTRCPKCGYYNLTREGYIKTNRDTDMDTFKCNRCSHTFEVESDVGLQDV